MVPEAYSTPTLQVPSGHDCVLATYLCEHTRFSSVKVLTAPRARRKLYIDAYAGLQASSPIVKRGLPAVATSLHCNTESWQIFLLDQ